jgi:2,4-dienoyl-CoA reductase-like NADH-dependent reductase (Old Yellow Enzyme family)
MYSKLFEALHIGPREARNRILFGSHATNLALQPAQPTACRFALRVRRRSRRDNTGRTYRPSIDMPYERAWLSCWYSRAVAEVVRHSCMGIGVQLNTMGSSQRVCITREKCGAIAST